MATEDVLQWDDREGGKVTAPVQQTSNRREERQTAESQRLYSAFFIVPVENWCIFLQSVSVGEIHGKKDEFSIL